MSEEEQTVLMIKGAIASLPPMQAEACNKLVEQISIMATEAGHVGVLAIALIGAEFQVQAAKEGF